MKRSKFLIIIVLVLAFAAHASAQRMPERGLVRKGNRQYNRERYEKSIESYTKALEADPASFEATYNLGSSLFRVERYDKAEQTLSKIVADSTRSDIERSEAVYNLGNTQFAQQKLKEALASYRQAMRLNPDDQEAKYNYAFTKKLLQQQEQQQQQDQQNQDQQNQNNDQQNQQDQQQNQQDQQGDKDEQQDQQDKQDPQQNEGDNQPKDEQQQGEAPAEPQGISPQEQQAMLDAIQQQEDKTQEKLKEKKGVLVRGRKNW